MKAKDHLPESDSDLSEDDYNALVSYRKEKKAGSLVSHEALKKELGLCLSRSGGPVPEERG
jgi:hypothetical protein